MRTILTHEKMVSRKCCIPNCSYKQNQNIRKRSLFQCPKDKYKARKWAMSIPGIATMGQYHYVCEIHFEPHYIRRYEERRGEEIFMRTRLTNDAVPTIFFNGNLQDYLVSTTFSNDESTHSFSEYNSVADHQMTQTFEDDNVQTNKLPTSTETSLQDVVKELSSSEKLIMEIKQEMFPLTGEETSSIKLENSEGFSETVKAEVNAELKEISVYEQLQSCFHYYSTLLPEPWTICQLPIGNDKVFVFSKECTVSENQSLVTMCEKNIVLDKSGNVHFSVHGKRLNSHDPDVPSVLNDIESLLDMLKKFNDVPVCQGICTSEYETDKDCTLYKDDLGYCRHVNCTLLTDKEQCNYCYDYSQHLLSIMFNNTALLNNGPVRCYSRIYN